MLTTTTPESVSRRWRQRVRVVWGLASRSTLHKDVHVAAVLTTLGVLLATCTFPTTAAGYRQLLAWARGSGSVRRAGVECTGSYGAALARYLYAETITVIEVNRGDRAQRRRRGKTDTPSGVVRTG